MISARLLDYFVKNKILRRYGDEVYKTPVILLLSEFYYDLPGM